MHRMILVISMLAFALLVLCGCDDKNPTPYLDFYSLNLNGGGFTHDNSLMVQVYGRAFYISDDLIFHLGNSLVRRGLYTVPISLSPSGMKITDTQYLAIDSDRQMLYFAADNAIYQVDYQGQNFSRLSPNDRAVYRAPALSSCGKYLTAIKDGQIARMEIQSGLWTVLEAPQIAYYALYLGDTDEYFFYSLYNEAYSKRAALCKITASQDSTLLMSTPEPNITDPWFNARVSSDYRYFAMLFSSDPREESDLFSSSYHRYFFPLNIYNRETSEQTTVQDCYSYSFVPSSSTVLYSSHNSGMTDLRRMDLSTKMSELIWDGYFTNSFYLYSVSEIYPRYDGQVLFLKAFDWWEVPHCDDYSISAPIIGDSALSRRTRAER